MNLTFLWMGIAVISTYLFIRLAMRGGAKKMKEQEEKLRKAKKAKAIILSYKERGSGRNLNGRYISAVFHLHIFPGNEEEEYEADTYWNVYTAGILQTQPGQEVDIRIDAEDATSIYPALKSADYNWVLAKMYHKKKRQLEKAA